MTVLVAILVGATAIRLVATLYGLPFGYHPDEEHILEPARRIAAGEGLDPGWYRYPPLPIWLHAALYAVVGRFVEDVPQTFSSVSERVWVARLVGRAFTAALGVTTIAVVWRAAIRTFGALAAGLAAGILAVAYLHVQHSAFITTDVPAAFAASLVLAATLRAAMSEPSERRRWWIVAAGLAGLAAGMKYNAGLVVLAPLLAWVTDRPREAPRALATCGAASALVFAAVAPVLLLDPSAALGDIRFEVEHYAEGGSALVEGHLRGQLGAAVLARFLFVRGTGLAGAIGVAAFAVSVWRRRERLVAASVLAFPVLYFAFALTLSVRNDRLLLPMLPFAVVAAGAGLARAVPWLAARLRVPHLVVVTVVASAAIVPLAVASVRTTVELVREDTRTRGFRFLDQYVPPTARICREWYTPEVPITHRAFLFPSVCGRGEEPLRARCDIVVTSSFIERLFVGNDDEAYVADCYAALRDSWRVIGQFTGTPIDIYNDPTVTFYANPGLALTMPEP